MDGENPNWSVVFNRLFKEIDGTKGGPYYYSGKDFIEKMQEVNPDTPEYPDVIQQRTASGQSTTRRDYFKDMFFQLEEHKKVKLILDIVDDIERRGHPACDEIRTLLGGGISGPGAMIPLETWNGDRLNDYLKKIDVVLGSTDPEAALTLSYTCLEGFFKAFVRKNIPEHIDEREITALAKLVKDYLKVKESEYPGEVFNVITQSAHAINRVRDAFSESHFGDEADLWVAIYVRDLVNTHIRLLLHFM
jgi:hypothetical protein